MLNSNDILSILNKINTLDYLSIIRQASILYLKIYFSSQIANGLILCIDRKPKDISRVVLPKDVRNIPEINIDTFAKQYRESVQQFANIVVENFPPEDLTNFYNNINSLIGGKYTIPVLSPFEGGSYWNLFNIININKRQEYAIYHELFHMASANRNSKIKLYDGFCITSLIPLYKIGSGINEGYTELLTHRYFSFIDFPPSGGYPYLEVITKKLEQIIGKRKMESYYLNSNLLGLISELKQYANESEIMQFINDTDFLCNLYMSFYNPRYISNTRLKNIDAFLIKCYSKKLQRDALDGNMSPYYKTTSLTQYISDLRMHRHKYEISLKDFIKAQFGFEHPKKGTSEKDVATEKNEPSL